MNPLPFHEREFAWNIFKTLPFDYAENIVFCSYSAFVSYSAFAIMSDPINSHIINDMTLPLSIQNHGDFSKIMQNYIYASETGISSSDPLNLDFVDIYTKAQ